MSEVRGDQLNQPEWHLIDGVRFYGRVVRDIEPTDLDHLAMTPESIMHVTRHLRSVSPEAREALRRLVIRDREAGRQVDDDFIDMQLASAGSKFHPRLGDPRVLMDFAKQLFVEALASGTHVLWIENPLTGEQNGGLQLTVTAEQKARLGLSPDELLGTSVVPITPEITARVRREPRGTGEAADRIVVNVIAGIEPPQTDTLVIVLKMRPGLQQPEFYSTYTGINSPKLPRPGEQSPEEMAYNQEWWSKHTFVR